VSWKPLEIENRADRAIPPVIDPPAAWKTPGDEFSGWRCWKQGTSTSKFRLDSYMELVMLRPIQEKSGEGLAGRSR